MSKYTQARKKAEEIFDQNQQTELAQLAGKTILSAKLMEDGAIHLTFSDGSVRALYSNGGLESGLVSISPDLRDEVPPPRLLVVR